MVTAADEDSLGGNTVDRYGANRRGASDADSGRVAGALGGLPEVGGPQLRPGRGIDDRRIGRDADALFVRCVGARQPDLPLSVVLVSPALGIALPAHGSLWHVPRATAFATGRQTVRRAHPAGLGRGIPTVQDCVICHRPFTIHSFSLHRAFSFTSSRDWCCCSAWYRLIPIGTWYSWAPIGQYQQVLLPFRGVPVGTKSRTHGLTNATTPTTSVSFRSAASFLISR